MPAIEPMYICDHPACTVQLPLAKTYSFSVYANIISDAPIASFGIPGSDQQLRCCCVNHSLDMTKDIVNNQLVADLQQKANFAGVTLQMDPPTA